MKKIVLLFFVFMQLLTNKGLYAQTKIVASPDSIIKPIVKGYMNKSFQLLSIGIIEDGKKYLYNFNSAAADNPAAIDYAPVYEIGSTSKSFGSFILAKAFLEHKANPDDDIRMYLKDRYPNLEYDGKPIKLIHLVNLTSGLPNNMPENPASFKKMSDDSMAFAFERLHKDYTKEKFLQDLHQVKLDTVPGFFPRHSNAAAVLLSFVLENIYHQSYSSMLKKFITGPLKMNNTFDSIAPDKIKLMAKGYTENGIQMPYVLKTEVAAFGLKSNINDMTSFMQFHSDEKDDAVKLAHKAAWGDANNFALGMNWFLTQSPEGKRIVKNDGTTFGFTTYTLMYPELKFGVVLMTNEYSFTSNDKLGKVAQEIFEQSFYTSEQRSSDGFGFSPNINLFLNKLNKTGFDHALEVFQSLEKNNSQFNLNETEINNWGYFLMQKNKLQQSLQIFKLNTVLHPDSWNAFDSYGEALLNDGQKEEAIKMYQKSVELNPGNENGRKVLDNLSKQ